MNCGDESLDDLLLGGLEIFQPLRGYRFSIDSVLLAHFPDLQDVHHIIDLGSGNGVIPLLLARRKPGLHITGLEIQPQMVERARRSTEHNRLGGKIKIECLDIRTLVDCFPAAVADMVICNPPFWKEGEGKINKNPEEALARHEIAIKLPQIIAAAAHVLKPRGRLAMIHRADRLAEIRASISVQGFYFTRLRMVKSFVQDNPKLVLLEGCLANPGSPVEEPPLIIYQSSGVYTPEVKSLYAAP